MEETELADSFEESLRLNQSSDSPAATAEELARFRQEWEAEVKERKRHPSGSATARATPAAESSSTSSHHDVSSRSLLVSSSGSTSRGPRLPLSSSKDGLLSSSVFAPLEGEEDEEEDGSGENVSAPIRLMRRSVLFYAQAVEAERSGDLDKALDLYRKSFRLDSNADRLYERASNAVQAEIDSEMDDIKARSDVLIQTEEVRKAIHRALDVEDYRYRAMVKQKEKSLELAAAGAPTQEIKSKSLQISDQSRDELSALIDRLAAESGGERNFQHMQFAPEDEERPLPIATLPEEVLLHILTFLAAPKGRRGARIAKPEEANHEGADQEERAPRKAIGIGVVLAGPDYMSIEALGRTCWRFRLLTRAWSVWRLIVRETYFPPQISPKVSLPALVGRHHNDWRTTFVDQPRVRLNGAFIAPCHYVREGMHEENVWVRVVHVVEFYRSLRFLPDGRALSLLTTDAPSQTVRRMEPSLRVKGFAIGTWTLYAQGLSDDDKHSRPAGPKIVVDNLQDKTMSRYSFRLILKLDKTSRGKWNRLEVLEYESINLETGEVCPLPLNHKKPFHFSTVRSYGI